MALSNINTSQNLISTTSIQDIGDIQTNCGSLLIYQTKEAFGPHPGTRLMLPFQDWRLATTLDVWFDVTVDGEVREKFMLLRLPMPGMMTWQLNHAQHAQRGVEDSPALQAKMLDKMCRMLDCVEVRAKYIRLLDQVSREWELLHWNWHAALIKLPVTIALPIANANRLYA